MSYVDSFIAKYDDPEDLFYAITNVLSGTDFSVMTMEERFISRIDNFLAQVNNGGFDQYFFNSGIWEAHECHNALSTIGSIKMKALIEKAIEIISLPAHVPEDYAYEATEEQEEELDKLDAAFYKISDEPYAQAYKFIIKNQSGFKGAG
jgi:hypothetical protein